ncbi:YbbR-like domain-containing protein [Desulfopila sp. IMCC35008]|uniref:CdaR family protein n=1 Tax=Desulfopila sp. IMCC35008 TaxID=2653858 RepID=UPI0013D3B8D8|nr:CdaR family protein [Desulfopila sp. IMCC35008]
MEKLALQGIVRFLRQLFSIQKWQRLWTKDWVLKVISLLLATVLWYYVGGEETVDKNVSMPIEIINLPRDLVISNQFKKEIEVTVSGPRSLIQEMTNKAVTRQINLADAMPGTNVIENNNDSIQVPRGITVLRIQPASIILSLDKLIQKQFPVIPVTTGDAALGYSLKNLRMDPDAITITGPETILSQVDELLTRVIDINGMTESKQIQVPLDLEPSIVELIGETSVTAEIIIQTQVEMKSLPGVPVKMIDGDGESLLLPDHVDIIANIPVLLLREKVDLYTLFKVTARLAENKDETKVEVALKEGVKYPIEILSVTPKTVKIVNGPSKTKDESQIEKKDPKPEEIEVEQDEQTVITVQPVVESKDELPQTDELQNIPNRIQQIPVIVPGKSKVKK